MNYKIVLVEVFAILVAALIFDLPLVGATQINIMYWSGSSWVKWDDVDIAPEDLADKDITVVNTGGSPFWSNPKLVINITNSTEADLERVYIYKCTGLSPDDCVETDIPDMHEILSNDLDIELFWNDISHVITACSSSPSSCLEVANLFFLFKINDNGKIIWVGVWNGVERRTYNFAEPYLFEYSLDEVDLHVQSDYLVVIKNFISSFLRIPLNPDWVSGAVFKGANSLYETNVSLSELQQPSPDFDAEDHTGNEIQSISSDYSFVFPNASYGIINPITLNLNPGFTCGNNDCEGDKGESSVTCCYDCPCGAGQYCDGGTEGVCRLEGLISLGLYETPDTVVSNCNEEHLINVTAKVEHAPFDIDLTRSEYILDDTVYSAQCEERFHGVYRCPVTVPVMPDCQEGEYSIGPNYLNFTIGYSDGPNPKSKDLVVQFPDITVGSFTCGENGCESGLGEGSSNCCYDCGCPQGYCDIADGAEKSTGTCRQDIISDNLQITANPTHFYTHNDVVGDRVNLNLQIDNSPVSLGIVEGSCEMDCSPECSASCSVTCSEIPSSDPDVFNASCLLTFTIDEYDGTRDYSLSPTLDISVTYNNGSVGVVENPLSRIFSMISVGASWCGDGVCAPDESLLECCYDCPCLEGYYCDTEDRDAPTAGDSCRLEEDIRLVVDGPEVTGFDYSDVSHLTNLTVEVENAPGSLEGGVSCVFGDGVECSITCERLGGGLSSHILSCNVSVPVINYKTSPLYNPDTMEITLGPNALNYSVTFNNGPDLVSKELSAGFSDLVINVKPRCGTGPGYLDFDSRCMPFNRTQACEGDLGEDPANCCCDCPCPSGEYCDINANEGYGECNSLDDIHLVIDGFDPHPLKCEIGQTREICIFYKQMDIGLHIEPEANYSVVSAYYEVDGEKYDMWGCVAGSDSPPWNKYSCPFIPLPIISETDIEAGTVSKDIKLSMDIESTGLLHTTIEKEGTFNIEKVDSEVLKTLEEQIDAFESQKKSLKTIKTVLWVILGVAAAYCTCTCIPCPWGPCCPGLDCGTCWIIYACISAALLPILIGIINKIGELETQLMTLEAARNPGEIYIAEQGTGAIWLSVFAAIASIVCMIGLMGGGLGAKEATTSSVATSETPPVTGWLGSRYPIFE